MNKFFLKNNDGQPSVTLTAFVLGFVVCNLKLLFAGLTIGSFVMGPFSGIDASAFLAALGGVYCLRNNSKDSKPEDKKE